MFFLDNVGLNIFSREEFRIFFKDLPGVINLYLRIYLKNKNKFL